MTNTEVSTMNNISSGSVTFVHLVGSSPTVKDVREWLERVDELGIADDTVLESAALRVRITNNS